ncbi:hypothetical protein BDF20DRAFT_518100 [Mycotypha africana]|uniref:uncharacterized protein n=1 Tax=Mycotypha africana TaxID=64632 RepID=UPI002301BF82|nr:uncharacterized protein BDF20DRAFT_518100 [Mycotypha africana]KAI8979572.1 hypothetical protein BDF20DRAFT_518100 [Mycotypha africana]
MLHVKFLTPFRIVLLVLVRRFCKFNVDPRLIPFLVQFTLQCIVDESKIQQTCTELSLKQLFYKMRVKAGEADELIVEEFLHDLSNHLDKTDECAIPADELHRFLVRLEKELPSMPEIHTVFSLNYARFRDYDRAIEHHNKSIVKSDRTEDDHVLFSKVKTFSSDPPYDLMGRAILEYKFDRFKDAKMYLMNLCQSRQNDDVFMQEVIQ